ncbi:MAG TPA: hypothetical protein VMC02_06970 [Steroidobacteraceae bacterium]|nr:hypothetical protein [Steroidobacteraceae bacterium]
MEAQDSQVQLTEERLRELMLWHGKDEGNLPPAATLVNLSRDTIAALEELQRTRTQLAQLRQRLGQLFWSSESRELRAALLVALGDPPEPAHAGDAPPPVSWAPSGSRLPKPAPDPDPVKPCAPSEPASPCSAACRA